MKNKIKFSDTIKAATFIAQLVREGVTFEAEESGNGITITLTGGF
jgi:hypothetical protein